MLEYAFEKVPSDRSVFVGKVPNEKHREMILRRAAEGWRYVGWIPSQQINGGITELDLIFEREQGGQA